MAERTELFYNEKEFLIKDSILACSMYHVKMYPNGEYKFRIHDCNTGIRLRGNLLRDKNGVKEAKEKFKKLREGIEKFEAYLNTLDEDISPTVDDIRSLH